MTAPGPEPRTTPMAYLAPDDDRMRADAGLRDALDRGVGSLPVTIDPALSAFNPAFLMWEIEGQCLMYATVSLTTTLICLPFALPTGKTDKRYSGFLMKRGANFLTAEKEMAPRAGNRSAMGPQATPHCGNSFSEMGPRLDRFCWMSPRIGASRAAPKRCQW